MNAESVQKRLGENKIYDLIKDKPEDELQYTSELTQLTLQTCHCMN